MMGGFARVKPPLPKPLPLVQALLAARSKAQARLNERRIAHSRQVREMSHPPVPWVLQARRLHTGSPHSEEKVRRRWHGDMVAWWCGGLVTWWLGG